MSRNLKDATFEVDKPTKKILHSDITNKWENQKEINKQANKVHKVNRLHPKLLQSLSYGVLLRTANN